MPDISTQAYRTMTAAARPSPRAVIATGLQFTALFFRPLITLFRKMGRRSATFSDLFS